MDGPIGATGSEKIIVNSAVELLLLSTATTPETDGSESMSTPPLRSIPRWPAVTLPVHRAVMPSALSTQPSPAASKDPTD